MRWIALLLASAACAAAAGWLAPPARRGPVDLAGALAAPIALPFLWRGIASSARHDSPVATVARARVLLRLLPCWTDGHILYASKLAYEAVLAAPNPDVAIDRLLGALALLEEAIALCPEQALELRLAQAFLLEYRIASAPDLAAVFQARRGRHPLEAAQRVLARIQTEASRVEVRHRQAYLSRRMVGLALHRGNPAAAARAAEIAIEQLAKVEPALRAANRIPVAEAAARHRQALVRLLRYLRGDSALQAAELRADPYLEDITADLR